jgi:hypothetical protein
MLWCDLAFPVVEVAVKRYFVDVERGVLPFHIEEFTRRFG